MVSHVDSLSTKILLPAEGLGREFLLHHGLCPLRQAPDGSVVVAAAEGARLEGLADIGFAYRAPVEVEQVSLTELERHIERLMSRVEKPIELARAGEAGDDLTADVRQLADQPPVIRYVNLLVRDAFDARASDINIEAAPDGPLVRFRLDLYRVTDAKN